MTKSHGMEKPIPDTLPYYRIMDEKVALAMKEYYEGHKLPEPFLRALLEKEPVDGIPNPYTRDAVMIHRWIQQWVPKRVWGTKKRTERWCEKPRIE